MRTFYTGSDIEDMAASGILTLEIGPGVALTDEARERAEQLRIVLVTPGSASPASKTAAQSAPAQTGTLPNRPRGCQHGPLPTNVNRSESDLGRGLVMDQLVEAVSALKRQGG